MWLFDVLAKTKSVGEQKFNSTLYINEACYVPSFYQL